MEGNLFHSESIDLNINLIQKNTFTETSRIFDRISEHSGQAKLTQNLPSHNSTSDISMWK